MNITEIYADPLKRHWYEIAWDLYTMKGYIESVKIANEMIDLAKERINSLLVYNASIVTYWDSVLRKWRYILQYLNDIKDKKP